jgi:hypothetical protein
MPSYIRIFTIGCRLTKKPIRNGLLAGLLVAVALLSCLAVASATGTKREPEVETKMLLSDVLELMKTRPLTLQQIEKTLHVTLALDAQNTNEYTLFYSARAKDSELGLESVEVRIPTGAATTKQRMLILSLGPSCSLLEAEVAERLGQPDELQVAHPADPEGTSSIYRSKTGELRFGIRRDPQAHIGTIVMAWEE